MPYIMEAPELYMLKSNVIPQSGGYCAMNVEKEKKSFSLFAQRY